MYRPRDTRGSWRQFNRGRTFRLIGQYRLPIPLICLAIALAASHAFPVNRSPYEAAPGNCTEARDNDGLACEPWRGARSYRR
jgi:hypothetical protein